jgi:hypothetical protein
VAPPSLAVRAPRRNRPALAVSSSQPKISSVEKASMSTGNTVGVPLLATQMTRRCDGMLFPVDTPGDDDPLLWLDLVPVLDGRE